MLSPNPSNAATAKALRDLSDAALRDIIVSNGPAWQDAWVELFHQRYGGVVADNADEILIEGAGSRTRQKLEARGFNPVPRDIYWDVMSALLEHMRGADARWNNLRRWDPDKGEFGSWLYKVVLHLCLRIRKGRMIEHAQAPESSFAPEQVPEPWTEEAEMGAWGEVREALAKLGKECQRIIWRRALGFSHAEIAALLGTAEGATRKRYQRCKEELRALLGLA